MKNSKIPLTPATTWRAKWTKKDVADTVDEFIEAVCRSLVHGKHIEIRGFGTFKVKDRKARMARNPRTGEPVPVPDRKVPVFKVSRELKELVAQPFRHARQAAFRLVLNAAAAAEGDDV